MTLRPGRLARTIALAVILSSFGILLSLSGTATADVPARAAGEEAAESIAPVRPGEEPLSQERIDRWRAMSPGERERIRERYRRWKELSPEQRARIVERKRRWRELPEEQRRYLKDRRELMKEAGPEDRVVVRNFFHRMHSLSAEARGAERKQIWEWRALPGGSGRRRCVPGPSTAGFPGGNATPSDGSCSRGPGSGPHVSSPSRKVRSPGIAEPAREAWMRAALREAEKGAAAGEIPVGAVVVSPEGGILSRAHNRSVTANDPTAHAEILALRSAARRTGNYRLTGCRLVVTLEPCPMCAGAAVIARVEEIIYGAPDPKSGAVSTLYRLASDPRLNHRAAVTSGVLAEECAALLTSFFRSRRPSPSR